ncbi:MAG: PAS domain S-box protein [Desulfuromonadaceae bacterium]|nr:PAS domain S-box protein [Desulfuromonadaceae bacterium]
MPRFLYRLRSLIPLIVFSATLLLVVLLTLERMRGGEKEIIRSITETAHSQMNQLQDIISDRLVRGELEQAKQRLSYAALSPQIVTLILADADHTVLIANNQEWVKSNAATISRYDKGRAEKANYLQQGDLFASDHGHLEGYYPITLSSRTGEIRPLQSGTLFVEYDFTERLNLLKHEAFTSAAKLFALLFLFALLLSYMLHILITKPVDRILRVVKGFAQGDLNVRSRLSGRNEIYQLALAFDEMADELSKNQADLHQQNVLLEEEVAERQMAQEALEEQSQRLEEEIIERRQAEEKLRIIYDAAQAGVIMVDANGVIIFANRCASQLYGFTPDEMTGSSYVEHVYQNERDTSANLLLRLIRGDDEAISAERHYLRKNGDDFWGFLNAKRHLDDNGTLISIIIVIVDITELKKGEQERDLLQQKFNQSQKMEAIGRLAGGVAHDFNNKLTVIMGYAELLRMQAKNMDEEKITPLEEILKAASHSCEITRKLLAFSRSEVISPQKVDLNILIADARKSLGRLIGEDIKLEFKQTADLWPALLDPTQIDQIIMNLAVNARDAMPDGGLFSIEAENVHIDEHCVHEIPNAQSGDYVQLTVSDTGCGMDKETLQHIFEPFFTTKEAGKGTGLGLATIYGIVSQNRGFINVYSEAGFGTTFKIYFPKMTSEKGLTTTQVTGTAVTHGSGTILLVEDDESLRKMVAEMLKEIGYTVLEAESPLNAIELCGSDDLKHIDLIVTDVIMPGMNGKEMSDRILENRPNIPVLFMSGYTADVITSKGILEESVHLIQKPFNLQKFCLKIQEALG